MTPESVAQTSLTVVTRLELRTTGDLEGVTELGGDVIARHRGGLDRR